MIKVRKDKSSVMAEEPSTICCHQVGKISSLLLILKYLDAIASPSSWVGGSVIVSAIASPSFSSLFSIQLKMRTRSLPSVRTHHCMVTNIFQGRQTPLECSFLSFNKKNYYLLCSFLIITYKSPHYSNAAKLRLQVI